MASGRDIQQIPLKLNANYQSNACEILYELMTRNVFDTEAGSGICNDGMRI